MGLFGLFGGKKEQSEYEGDGCVAIVPPLEPPRVPVDDGEGGLMLVWCDRVFFFFSLFLTHSPLFFETPAPSPFFRASATTRPASSRCRNAPPESSTAASKAPREGAHSAPRGSASALSLGQNPRTLSLFSGVKKKRRRRPKKPSRRCPPFQPLSSKPALTGATKSSCLMFARRSSGTSPAFRDRSLFLSASSPPG